MSNYYEILGVERDADQPTLKRAYKALAQQWHPDKPTGDAGKFAEIAGAYNTLRSEELRRRYDALGADATPETMFEKWVHDALAVTIHRAIDTQRNMLPPGGCLLSITTDLLRRACNVERDEVLDPLVRRRKELNNARERIVAPAHEDVFGEVLGERIRELDREILAAEQGLSVLRRARDNLGEYALQGRLQ